MTDYETNAEIIENRVARGVDWLDENVPDWAERVEVKTLEMASPCRCVLGQVFSAANTYDKTHHIGDPTGYDLGLDLAYDQDPVEFTSKWAEDRGFDGETDAEFAALGIAWTKAIEARRAVKA